MCVICIKISRALPRRWFFFFFFLNRTVQQGYRQHLGYNIPTKVILKERDDKISHSESTTAAAAISRAAGELHSTLQESKWVEIIFAVALNLLKQAFKNFKFQ